MAQTFSTFSNVYRTFYLYVYAAVYLIIILIYFCFIVRLNKAFVMKNSSRKFKGAQNKIQFISLGEKQMYSGITTVRCVSDVSDVFLPAFRTAAPTKNSSRNCNLKQ